MTTALILRRQAIAMPRIPRERHVNVAAAMILVDAGILVVRPVLVTAAIFVAAAGSMSSHPAAATNTLPSPAPSSASADAVAGRDQSSSMIVWMNRILSNTGGGSTNG